MGDSLYLIIGAAILVVVLVLALVALPKLRAGGRGHDVASPETGTDVIAPPPTEADVETPTEAPPAVEVEPERRRSRSPRAPPPG